MKTAMQELRDILENCKVVDITDEQKSIFSSIIYQIDIHFLEKEKEQIIDFGYKCRDSKNNLPQDIFNSIYNQNK